MHERHLNKQLPNYAYTVFHENGDVWGILPIWAVTLLALGIPNFIYLISTLVVRSFWDFNNAVYR